MSRPLPSSFFSGNSPIAVVSGDLGFLGFRVCEELLKKKLKVVGVSRWDERRKVLEDPNFYTPDNDIGDTRSSLDVISRADYVVHITGFETSHQVIKNLLEFSLARGARFLLVLGLFGDCTEEELVLEYVKRKDFDARIVKTGDVYGPGMRIDKASEIGNLLLAFVHNKPLCATNVFVYPTYLDDVVWGIEKSLFSSGTRGATVSLVGEQTITAGVAEAIRSLRPGTNLEYVGGKANERFLEEAVLRAGRGLISWDAHTQLIEGMALTLDWVEKEKHSLHAVAEQSSQEEVPDTSIVSKPESLRSFWEEFSMKRKHVKEELKHKWFSEHAALGVLLVGLVVLAFWFFVLPIVMYGFGVGNLKVASIKIDKKEYASVPLWGSASAFWFKQAEGGFGKWALPVVQKIGQGYVQRSQILSRTAGVLVEKGEIAREFVELTVYVFGGENASSTSSFSSKANKLASRLVTLEQELAFLEAQIASLPGDKKSFSYLPQDIDMLRADIRASSGLLFAASYLLGEDSRRTYLVLIQDNTELRPTGGYVEAYGLLTFDRGHLVSSEFQDTELADSQLSGHVEPPAPIKTYLKEKSWYLRDVSWSGDFSTTAARAAWFVEKELTVTVDGVIGIDLEYLKSLLSATGSLEVQSLGRVTGQNIYDLLRKANSAASTSRSRGIVYLVRSVFDEIKRQPELFAGSFIPITFENLRTKHVTIFVDEPKVKDVLEKAGWSGHVREGGCKFPGGFCQADYLYFTEANLGVNKANYFLDRSYNLDVTLINGRLVHRLSVGYRNGSTGEWPGGEYRNYFRAYIPANSENFSAFLVNQDKPEHEEVSLNLGSEKGKRTLGGFLSVPVGESRQLALVWETPVAVGLGQYSLLWQKQAGTGADPVWLTVSNKGRSVGLVTPLPSLTTRESIGYNTKLTRDLEFSVQWQQ